jgi:hypothetical protein
MQWEGLDLSEAKRFLISQFSNCIMTTTSSLQTGLAVVTGGVVVFQDAAGLDYDV